MQHKPPKHLLLPYAIKTLTGNTELIQILIKFGLGVSYSQLEEIDTALCPQKLAASLNQRVVLPTAIQPYTFTNLAWGHLEETLTGKGTSHIVNGMTKMYGPARRHKKDYELSPNSVKEPVKQCVQTRAISIKINVHLDQIGKEYNKRQNKYTGLLV